MPAVTNEGVLFEMGGEEHDRMLEFALDRRRPIKTAGELGKIGFITDDEESIASGLSGDKEAREEIERRKTKLMGLKAKRRTTRMPPPTQVVLVEGKDMKEEAVSVT